MALVLAPPDPGDAERRSVSLENIVNVGLDPWASIWMGTNGITLESVALPYPSSEGVVAIFNDEGDGVFSCDAENCEPIVIEHIMKLRAVCESGCYKLQEKIKDSEDYRLVGTLEQVSCIFDLGSVTCDFGPLRTSQVVDIAIFERPRSSCRVFWSLLSVHKVSKFSNSSGFASTWLHKNLPSWSSMLQGLDMRGTIIRSRPCGDEAASHMDRPTPFVAASSQGLLALLLSWGFSSPRWCGMKGEANVAAAQCFVAGWLEIVYNKDWELCIFLSATVQIRWPRPWEGEHPIALKVTMNGMVSLVDLKALAALSLQSRDPKAKFAAYLMGLCEGRDSVPLLDLLSVLARERKHPWALSLLSQCVHRVGERLDAVVISMLDSEYIHPWASVSVSGVDVSSDYKLDRTLLQYTDMAAQTFAGAQFVSVAADCSRVGSQALQNAVLVDDKNRAAWLVPQVVEDYTDEVELAEMMGGPAAAEEALEARQKRQLAWAERNAESNPSEWRAPKKPRVASYNFIRYLDNQVMHGTGAGLVQFQQPAKEEDRLPAEQWPKLCVALDQHATQLCAVSYMLRKLCVNIEPAWDLAHGNWRDLICSLKEVGYWPFVLLALIAFNTPSGPWDDDARFQQCKSAMSSMFKRMKPDNTPLFLRMLPQLMLESGSEAALSSQNPEASVEVALQFHH